MVESPPHSSTPTQNEAKLDIETKANDTTADGGQNAVAETKTEDETLIDFRCSECRLYEKVHYHGRSPPFCNKLEFLEDTYVMLDPFQPPMPRYKVKPEYFIAIGAECCRCNRVVCKDTDCSFFYTKTYCLSCAEKKVKSFPVEAQVRLRKQLSNKKS